MRKDYPEIRPLGLDALIVRFAGGLDDVANRATLAFAAAVRAQSWAHVTEVAPALTSVLIRFDPLASHIEELIASVETLLGSRDWLASDLPAGRRHWTVPVALDGDAGPQFEEAAAAAGQSPQALSNLIAATKIRVLTLGFAPGQPYMGMLPKEWDIPRQSGLTPEVPAGALVMAVRQLIIFARPAPTGWRQIGLTGFRPFRAEAPNPIALAPGDEMSFEIMPLDDLPRSSEGNGGARCEVLT